MQRKSILHHVSVAPNRSAMAAKRKSARLLDELLLRLKQQAPDDDLCHRLRRRRRQTNPAPYLFTASLNALPAANLTVFDAAI